VVAAPLALARLERGVVPDRHEDVLERSTPRMVGVGITGDDGLDPGMRGKIAQKHIPVDVAALEGALQLHVEALWPEDAGERGGRVRITDAKALAGTA